MSRGNRWLIAVLVSLMSLVVVLVIVMVLINSPRNNGAGDLGNCVSVEDEDEQILCLENVYFNEGNKTKVDAAYGMVLDKVWKEGDYSLFVDVLSAEAELYARDERCDEAMAIIEDDRISELSGDDLANYYSYAVSIPSICENDSKVSEFRAKLQELYDTGEVEMEEFIEPFDGIEEEEEDEEGDEDEEDEE